MDRDGFGYIFCLHYDSNHPIVAKFETQVPAFNGLSKGIPGTGDLTHPDMGCELVCGSSAEKVIFVTEPKKNAVCPTYSLRTAGKCRRRTGRPSTHRCYPHTIIGLNIRLWSPCRGAENLPAGAAIGASTVSKREHHCLAEIAASL
jgi:Fe-S-cluster containining protein